MSQTWQEKFRDRFGPLYKENEPLAKHLNIRLGGPAEHFVECKTIVDVRDAVHLAVENNLPWFVLGGGSNTLVADEGWSGVAIKIALRSLEIHDDGKVVADAGVIAALVARQSAERGLTGFEWAISLPGTIGGAVRGNAGCFGGETKDHLVSATLLRDGEIVEVSAKDLRLSYRHSLLKDSGNRDIVLRATFQLTPGNREAALAKIDATLAGRKSSQPLGSASAGCMFKNIEWKDDQTVASLTKSLDVPADMFSRKRIAAGWLIEQMGAKGLSVGDAQVSGVHGNFMLNKGQATAADMHTLVTKIQQKAKQAYGIDLEPEVQFYGF